MKTKHSSELGGCLCFSCRTLVILTGCFSVISSLSAILVSLYIVINTEAYYWISDQISAWLQMHQGDKEVLDITHSYLAELDTYHQSVLYGIMSALILHLLLSLLLLLGAALHKHLLLIPWMVTDLILIIILFLIFSTWSFLSFFVGLLAAIIFPFFGGLTLGVKIMLWRQVLSLHRNQVSIIKMNREYEVLKNNDASNGRRRTVTGKMETITESAA